MSSSLLPLVLLVLGFLCQWLAWRVRLPAILFLLLTGIVLGPATGLLDPDALLGDLLFPLVSLGVAIILFEGSLGLRWQELRGVAPAVINLVSIGALVSLGTLAAAAHYLLGLSWELSLLFGALTCVTGPTVVVPMLRSVRPNARIANVLRWEGIIIDPLGALFAVLVYSWIVLGLERHTFTEALAAFGWTTLTGCAFGVVGAVALGGLLRRHWIPEYLQNYAALVAVLSVFSLSNAVAHESGLLAVTIMGMWLGNRSRPAHGRHPRFQGTPVHAADLIALHRARRAPGMAHARARARRVRPARGRHAGRAPAVGAGVLPWQQPAAGGSAP
ncbi:MAG: hypothetical protein KatS3mg126_0704 [Lysobacteraceae bacterium]|nr:MAG: hypothetical protein KatS3mg126_0704 [Xanthomonadaceae bacterium]